MKLLPASLCASVLLSLSVWAQVPQVLGYQGRLLKADGSPASGVVTITFAIFAAPTGGAALWQEDQTVALTDGLYAVFLGSVTPFPSTLFPGADRYLELTVGGTALSPRQRVGSVAYALTAEKANNGLPTGAISEFAGSAAPPGFHLCDGAAISRTTYAALFAVIGTTYGAGDGSTTFNVPNLSRRFPLGKGSSDALGGTGGQFDHTHSTPAHTHFYPGNANSGLTSFGVGFAKSCQQGSFANCGDHQHDQSIPAFTIGPDGSGNSGTANPPYLVVNYLIKL